MTRGYNSTFNYDPGSKFHDEWWPLVWISHWILIPIPGLNLTLNHDSGSKFNVEFRPGVIIQCGIKTRGHNSTGGQNFIRRRGRNTMTPCLGGRNSTWKICWILSTARWIKTPRVKIQWGQNSILHRQTNENIVNEELEHLNDVIFNKHVAEICKAVSNKLNFLRKIKKYLSYQEKVLFL